MSIPGVTLMTPSSVSVAAGSASIVGSKVTFSGATDMVVNGVFSSAYDNYMVVCRHFTSSGELVFPQLTAAGSVVGGSNYFYQNLGMGTGATAVGSRSSGQVSWVLYSDTNRESAFTFYFFRPAVGTGIGYRAFSPNGDGGQATFQHYAGGLNATVTADGFRLASAIGQNGSLTVHGFTN